MSDKRTQKLYSCNLIHVCYIDSVHLYMSTKQVQIHITTQPSQVVVYALKQVQRDQYCPPI